MSFDGQSYAIDNKQFPRVTRILGVLDKPFLATWQRKMVAESVYAQLHHDADGGTLLTDMTRIKQVCDIAKLAADQYRDQAADRGKRIHDFLEAIFNNDQRLIQNYLDNDEHATLMANIMENAAKWVMQEGVQPVEVEKLVVSRKHGYAGTCDLICTMENHAQDQPPVLAVVDWKTGGGVYDTHTLQMAAYAKAYEEMTGKKVDIAFVMHITPARGQLSPKLHLHQWDINNEFETFLKVLDLYKWRNNHG